MVEELHGLPTAPGTHHRAQDSDGDKCIRTHGPGLFCQSPGPLLCCLPLSRESLWNTTNRNSSPLRKIEFKHDFKSDTEKSSQIMSLSVTAMSRMTNNGKEKMQEKCSSGQCWQLLSLSQSLCLIQFSLAPVIKPSLWGSQFYPQKFIYIIEESSLRRSTYNWGGKYWLFMIIKKKPKR